MLLNSFSIALLICSIASIMLMAVAFKTAIRVLRHWDLESDSAEQIALEGDTWFASQLIQLSLSLQIISLFLLMVAANSFAEVLVGAMCAAGAFQANSYGPLSLLTKLVGVFFYGYWIIFHRFDIQSQHYPLMRFKFTYLLLLAPILGADLFFTMQYLRLLEPDIITSCCGVLFGTGITNGYALLGPLPFVPLLTSYVGISLFLLAVSVWWSRSEHLRSRGTSGVISLQIQGIVYGVLWLAYFGFSLVVITSVISPYVYGMPAHRCPFDLLHSEYHYVGFLIYLLLLGVCFFGSSGNIAMMFVKNPYLIGIITHYRRLSMKFCVITLPAYLVLIGYYPAAYLLFGGER